MKKLKILLIGLWISTKLKSNQIFNYIKNIKTVQKALSWLGSMLQILKNISRSLRGVTSVSAITLGICLFIAYLSFAMETYDWRKSKKYLYNIQQNKDADYACIQDLAKERNHLEVKKVAILQQTCGQAVLIDQDYDERIHACNFKIGIHNSSRKNAAKQYFLEYMDIPSYWNGMSFNIPIFIFLIISGVFFLRWLYYVKKNWRYYDTNKNEYYSWFRNRAHCVEISKLAMG